MRPWRIRSGPDGCRRPWRHGRRRGMRPQTACRRLLHCRVSATAPETIHTRTVKKRPHLPPRPDVCEPEEYDGGERRKDVPSPSPGGTHSCPPLPKQGKSGCFFSHASHGVPISAGPLEAKAPVAPPKMARQHNLATSWQWQNLPESGRFLPPGRWPAGTPAATAVPEVTS